LTLRELLAMAEGRQRHDWCIAASLMALVANTQRNPKRNRPFRPSDFDPFAKPQRPIRADVSVLKDVFIHGRPPSVAGLGRQADPDSECKGEPTA
jgi:hypothetical protein